jgi:hypothetical protein
MGITIILGLAIWYLIGMYSFYYWWTKDHNINTNPKLLSLWFSVGLLGIASWFICRGLHSGKPSKNDSITLFKNRG